MRLTRYTAIVVLGGLGAFLACGFTADDRAIWQAKRHVTVIQNHLADLKAHLLKYRQVHGRYPSNDEGLAVLDNFTGTIVVGLGWWPEHRERAYSRIGWPHVQERLKEYRRQTGHAPRTASDLNQAIGLCYDVPSDMDNAAMTLAVTDNDNLIPLGRGGAFSPWMTPHVYENRHGLNSEKFRDSPASGDWWGHYSIKVDKDIYVYSIGGELYSQRLHWAWWTYHGPRIAGAAMLIAAIAILIVRVKRGAAKMVLGMVALTASVGAGTAVTFVGHVLCYAMMPAFSRRDPEMIDRQRALLTTYRQRGVLGEAAYKTALEALENGPATTRPAGAASQKHK